jgi:purine-binding chemotaxis protein CheW
MNGMSPHDDDFDPADLTEGTGDSPASWQPSASWESWVGDADGGESPATPDVLPDWLAGLSEEEDPQTPSGDPVSVGLVEVVPGEGAAENADPLAAAPCVAAPSEEVPAEPINPHSDAAVEDISAPQLPCEAHDVLAETPWDSAPDSPAPATEVPALVSHQKGETAEPPVDSIPPVAVIEDEEPPEPERAPVSAGTGRLESLLEEVEEDVLAEEDAFHWAAQQAPEVDPGLHAQHVVFSLAETEYAVPIGNVVEIGHPRAVTPLPQVPEWLRGLTNLRGDIISIVDLRGFLGLEPGDAGRPERMLVVHHPEDNLTTGLIVDRVLGITRLRLDAIREPSAPVAGPVAPYLRGVAEHARGLLVVLDLDRLLRSSEMRQFELV